MKSNNSRDLRCLAVAALLSSLSVVAGADGALPTYYMTGGNSSGTNPYLCQYWKDADGNAIPGLTGSDKIPKDADYVVRNSAQLRVEGYRGAFPGNTLALGDGSEYGSMSWDSGEITIGRLKAVRGTFYYNVYGTGGAFLRKTYTGDVEVLSPKGSPFVLTHENKAYSNHEWRMPGSVTGDAGTELQFGRTSSNCPSNSTFSLEGDWSGFKGDISVRSSYPNTADGHGVKVRFVPNELAGSVSMGAGTVLSATAGASALKVGDLAVDSGSRLEVAIDSTKAACGIVVDNAFTKGADPVDMRVSASGNFSVAHRLLTVPESTSLGVADLRVTFADGTPDYFKQWWPLAKDEPGDGTVSFSCRLAPSGSVVYLKTSDSSDKDRSSGTSSLEKPANWSNEQGPVAGSHCLIVGKTLRTPVSAGNDVTFEGDTIRLADGQLSLFCRRLVSSTGREPDLYTFGNSTILCGQMITSRLGSRLDVGPGKVDLQVYSSNEMTLDGEVSGLGDVWVTGVKWTSSTAGYTYLYGINTNFFGSILVTNYENVAYGGAVQTLTVTNGLALGGALYSFNFRALELTRGAAIRTSGEAPVVFARGMNRGMFVRGENKLRVQKRTDLDWPVTYEGTLHFAGESSGAVLRLGAVPQFSAGDAAPTATPSEGLNVLSVETGTLKPTVAHALDGVKTKFASANARLVLPLDFSDDELTEKGLVNVKTDTPFELANGMDKIPFSIEIPDGIPANVKDFGILTVTANAASWVRAKLPRLNGPYTHVSEVVNADGSVTFKASRSGLMMVIR